jgi:uncharacterized FlaG/YvyC family protein
MSDAVPVTLPVSLVPANQTSIPASVPAASGNSLPQSGKSAGALPDVTTSSALRANAQNQNATSIPPKATATNKASVADLVKQLNKFLNDSGRADQFRIDPESRNQIIQEINPANGAVVGEFSVSEFPALARSLGVSGILVDSHA